MVVLKFAWGSGGGNVHLPHMHYNNSFCYPGTHDNETCTGWFKDRCVVGDYIYLYIYVYIIYDRLIYKRRRYIQNRLIYIYLFYATPQVCFCLLQCTDHCLLRRTC